MNTFDIVLHGNAHYSAIVTPDGNLQLYYNASPLNFKLEKKIIGAKLLSYNNQLTLHAITNTYRHIEVNLITKKTIFHQDEIYDIDFQIDNENNLYTAIANKDGVINVSKNDSLLYNLNYSAAQLILSEDNGDLYLAIQEASNKNLIFFQNGEFIKKSSNACYAYAFKVEKTIPFLYYQIENDYIQYIRNFGPNCKELLFNCKAMATLKDNNNENEVALLMPDNQILFYKNLCRVDSYTLGQSFNYKTKREPIYEKNKPSILGEGTYGMVFKGTYQQRPVAIKEFKYQDSETTTSLQLSSKKPSSYSFEDAEFNFHEEFYYLSILKHENIVTLIGGQSTTTQLRLYTELAPQGNLAAYIEKKQSPELWPEQYNHFAFEITAALNYLHSNQIIHADLKTANILLDENLHVKIADFGNSEQLPPNRNFMGIKSYYTTIMYCAPECLSRAPILHKKSDIYSVGCIFWEMITGVIPWSGHSEATIIANVTNNFRPIIPKETPVEINYIIDQCFFSHPTDRPTANQLNNSFQELLTETSSTSLK